MSQGRSWFARVLPPLLVLVGVAIAWDAYVRLSGVSPIMLPRPSRVLRALITNRQELVVSLYWTTIAALIGFGASALIGILIAIALSGSVLLRRALYPYTLFFQTVPIVAIAPMLLFWMDVGIAPVAVCAFIVSVFPVIANTLSGLLATDPALIDLFRLYRAGGVAGLWKLRLPWALPNIFTGLRIAAGLAVIGTVVAEFLVGQIVGHVGLGVRVVGAIREARTDLAFASVLLASLLGLAMFGAVNLAARVALRHWHASE